VFSIFNFFTFHYFSTGKKQLAQYMYGRRIEHLDTQQKVILAAIYGYFSIILFIVIPVIFFRYMERWDVITGVYFVIVSLTTVGFGDYTPNFSQVWKNEISKSCDKLWIQNINLSGRLYRKESLISFHGKWAYFWCTG